jgi:hypothetical protein
MSVLSSQQSLTPGVLPNLPVRTQFFTLLQSLGKVRSGPSARTEVITGRFASGSRTLRMGDGTTTLAPPRIEGLGSLTTTYEPLAQVVFISDVELRDGKVQQATLDEAAMAAMTDIQRDIEAGFWTSADQYGVAFANLQTIKGGSTNTTGWVSPIAKGSQTNTVTGKAQTGVASWQHYAELSAATFNLSRANTVANEARREGGGVAFSAISDACYAKLVAAMPAQMAYTKIGAGADDAGTELEMFGGAPLYRPSNSYLGITVADAAPANHTLSMVSFGKDSFHLAFRENGYFDKGSDLTMDPRNTAQPGKGFYINADCVFKVDRLLGIAALFDAET